MQVLQDAHRGVPIKAWVDGVQLEAEAKEQLFNTAALPFVYKHIAVMPDVHWGMGATVGSVVPTVGAIVPAAVGVDIGCGMMAVRTQLQASDLPDSLAAMRSAIERAVPHGRTDNGGAMDRGSWGNPPLQVEAAWGEMMRHYAALCERHPQLRKAKTVEHLGTLGTGNHFIEVCLDEQQRVWVMLHSGSRGIGNRIGSYFIEKAKRQMERWFVKLPDANLAYLPEGVQDFKDYVEAVGWAQNFAQVNREVMMRATLQAVSNTLGRPIMEMTDAQLAAEPDPTMAINCHHNYVQQERHFGQQVWLTRKGAVSAQAGQLGIIPGSMGARSYIVQGKGNRESFMSCSHGAGRAMSRTEARKRFSVLQHCAATAGVECRKDESVLDETPGAYKDIDAVMAAQSDLVDIVHTLKQVLCVKG